MIRPLLLAIVALPLVAACSSSGGGGGGGSGGTATGSVPTMDAGTISDAAQDAPMDASLDGPTDAALDAGACTLVTPYSSQDTDCNTCAEGSCCVEVNTCLLDPDCDDGYVNCAIVCAIEATDAGTDPACLDACAKQYPTGAVEYDAAIGCVDAACVTECQ